MPSTIHDRFGDLIIAFSRAEEIKRISSVHLQLVRTVAFGYTEKYLASRTEVVINRSPPASANHRRRIEKFVGYAL